MELRIYLRVLFKYWWLVLIAFVVTLGFTAWFTFRQEPVYESSATYIVRPTLSTEIVEDTKGELDALDVLGRRGDIASTFAEMANSRQIKIRAAESLGLSSSERQRLSVDSQLVSGTYLLKITVLGHDPELVSDFANMIGVEVIRFVEDLYATYELVSLDPATAPSSPSKPNRMLNLALGAALGLVLGAALAFLAYYLQSPVEAAITQVVPAQGSASPAIPAEAPRSHAAASTAAVGHVIAADAPARDAAPSEAVASQVVAVEAPASDAAPAEAIASQAVAAEVAVGDLQEEGEAIEVPAETPRIIPVKRSLVGWIAAAVLTVVLIVAASAIWLSGQGTSAASLPTETSTVPVALTAPWTATALALPTNTAMPTTVPSVTDTLEPSATPTTELSATPTTEPSATPTTEPSAMPTTEPSATAISSPTATATEVPTQAPTNTPSPTPRPTEAALAPTRPVATSTPLPAPALLSPPDRQDFSPDAEIVLAWQPVEELAADAYYAVSVAYTHLGETWFDDVPWTRSTTWTLTEHSYLQDLSDNGQFVWSVQVVRQTGTDASGKPTGVSLSAPSEERMVTWRRESGGGGGGGGGGANTPAPPPP